MPATRLSFTSFYLLVLFREADERAERRIEQAGENEGELGDGAPARDLGPGFLYGTP